MKAAPDTKAIHKSGGERLGSAGLDHHVALRRLSAMCAAEFFDVLFQRRVPMHLRREVCCLGGLHTRHFVRDHAPVRLSS